MKPIAYALALTLSALFTLITMNAAEAQAVEQKATPTHDMTEGEVRRVNKGAKKLTIRHGPIKSLDMPAMTMVYQVKNPAMLDKVKTGDKIKFGVEKAGTGYTVTGIEVVK